MNNGELKQKLRGYSHRTDLEDVLQGFINAATENINRRFCMTLPTMVNDEDSNEVIAHHGETLYFFAAMVQLSQYIKDWEQMGVYRDLYRTEANQINLTANSDEWSGAPLIHVESETEVLVNGS